MKKFTNILCFLVFATLMSKSYLASAQCAAYTGSAFTLGAPSVTMTTVTFAVPLPTGGAGSKSAYSVTRGATLVNAAATGTPFVDNGPLTAGTTYTYTVVATENSTNNCTKSATVNATTTADPCAGYTGTPTLSLGTVTQTSVAVNIALPAGLAGTTSYTITRNGLPLTLPSQPLTGFVDNTVLPNTSYTYNVTAKKGACNSTTSANLPATTTAFPIPSTFTATVQSQTQIKLDWTDVAGESGYEIFMSVGTSPSFVHVATTGANATSTTIPNLNPNTTYNFTIRAVFGALYSAFLNPAKSATTSSFPVPDNLFTTILSPTQIKLDWTNVTGESGYEIFMSTGTSTTFVNNATTGANATSTTISNLNPNTTYNFTIRSVFGTLYSAFLSPAKSATTPALPPATGLTVSTSNCSTLDLKWNDPVGFAGFNELGFEIYRSEGVSSAGAVRITNVNQNVLTYSDKELKANTTYTYYVVAIYTQGPAVPTNVVNTGKTSAFNSTLGTVLSLSAQLSWTKCSPNIVAYKVYLAENGGVAKELATLLSDATSYQIKGLTPSTNYTTYVIPIYNSGWGGGSTSHNFTTLKFPAPSNLKAEPISSTSMKVTWKDNSSGPEFEEAFYLYRDKQDGTTAVAIPLKQNAVEYIDNNLTPNSRYCYYVVAAYNIGFSEPSNVGCDYTCPVPITKIDMAEATSTSTIKLTWTVPAGNAAATTKIEQSFDGVTYTVLSSVAGNIGNFEDGGLNPNQKKYYRLRVENAGTCKTPYTEVISSRTCALAPTNVIAIAQSSSKMLVKWDEVSDITKYIVERSDDNIDYIIAGEVTGDKSEFTDTNLQSSKKYYYRVSVQNESGCISAKSEVKQPSTATTCPGPPTNLIATAVSAKEIKLTFTDNAPDETGFEVQWSLDGTTFVKVGEILAANTTSVNITTGVDAETKYFFRLRSLGSACSSDFSATASITTNPPAPTGLTAKGVKINQIDLAWANPSKTSTGIEVQRALATDNNFTKLTDLAANATSYSNTALNPGTIYKYRVRNNSASGVSDWSNVAEGTTLVITAKEDESLAKSITLYPVPTQNTLSVKSTATVIGKVKASILNANGSKMMQHEFNGLSEGKTEHITVSGLQSGIYFLELTTATGKVTKKFLKQ